MTGGIFTVCMVRALLSHVTYAPACCYYCSTYTSWPNQADTSGHNLGLAQSRSVEVPQDEAEVKDDRRSTDIPGFRKVADHLSREAKPNSERINCFCPPTHPPPAPLPNNLLAGAEI